jgi:hypothetical protein
MESIRRFKTQLKNQIVNNRMQNIFWIVRKTLSGDKALYLYITEPTGNTL